MSVALIGKGLVIGAVAASALVAGGHTAQSTDSPTAATSAQTNVVCHRLHRHAPAQLKQDLRAARKLPAGEARTAARQKIRQSALDGTYGKTVQQRLEHRKQQRAHWRRNAPAQLKQDLRATRKLPAGEARTAARQKIRQSALDGTYGKTVQQRLEHRKAHRDACQAQRKVRMSQQQS